MSIFRAGLFEGQTVLVTGGGTGIGRAIARELHGLGASLILAGRRAERLAEVTQELGERCVFQVADIRDETSVAALFDGKRVDMLVNNAGGQFLSPAEKITPKGWRAVLETNLTGTFLMSRQACLSGTRSIVSIVAEMWRGFPGMAHTGAARAGVVNLTRTLAVEWAARGIRVNAVAPGIIDSEGLESYGPGAQALLEQAVRDVPAQRMGTEQEVAAAVVFLLSPAAAYITGETLRVDGAGSLWRKTWDIPSHETFPPFRG
jgi:citronellol/citronellal dehydrogenase